jgi:hypothetical protein
MESAEVSKNITLDDVRQALGDTDPHSTNSSKLRAELGRGSFATIQKHLDTIRAEVLAAQQPAAVGEVPAMPDDFAGLWAAAYACAVATVRGRLDAVVSERDALLVTVASARGDVEALEQVIEEGEAVSAAQAARISELDLIVATLGDNHATALSELTAGHAATVTALEAGLKEAQYRVEIGHRDHQLAEQKNQGLVDRLTDQIGELKSLLHATKAAD